MQYAEFISPAGWSIREPVLVLAPHLCLPARNGADISLERVSRHLSRHSTTVELIGCDFHRRYAAGEVVQEALFTNTMRGKRYSALRTLARGSHYLLERFNTPRYQRYLREHVDWARYGTILASFLITRELIPPLALRQRLLIWTHNDEVKWFRDRFEAERNLVARRVALNSYNWLRHNLARLARGATWLHVSESDRAGYARLLPEHDSIMVPIGTDLDEAPKWPDAGPADRVILSFVGALSVQMAADALQHFQAAFFPQLQASFGNKLVVRMVGSAPSLAVQQMARQPGWELHADVSDEQLARLLRESTFTLLPFPYATGVKLKLVRSLGSGVPYLSTLAAGRPDIPVPEGCCCSDAVADWVAAITFWRGYSDKTGLRAALLALARQHSWGASTDRIVGALTSAPPAGDA